MAATRDLSIYRGDDYQHTLTFYSDDAQTTRLDLSTYTSFTAKIKTAADGSTLATFSVSTTNVATGVIVLSLSNTTTAAMTSDGYWDFQWTDPNSKKFTPLKGRVTLSKDIT